jgi:NTP pyrophosphatase (non-canonical NTP hydrolase)
MSEQFSPDTIVVVNVPSDTEHGRRVTVLQIPYALACQLGIDDHIVSSHAAIATPDTECPVEADSPPESAPVSEAENPPCHDNPPLHIEPEAIQQAMQDGTIDEHIRAALPPMTERQRFATDRIFDDLSKCATATTAQLSDLERKLFLMSVDRAVQAAYTNAVRKGFWPSADVNLAEALMLMVTELAEACEAERRGNPTSEHITGFSAVEEELADVILRIYNLCGKKHWRIAEAVLAKLDFNATRPYLHGKKF